MNKKKIKRPKLDNLNKKLKFAYYLSYREFFKLLTIKNITIDFKEQFIELLYQNFSKLELENGENKTRKIIKEKLTDLTIYEREFSEYEKSTGAYYRNDMKSIFYRKESIKNWDKRTIFHELIHYFGRNIINSNFNNFMSNELIEGGTENIAERVYGEEEAYNTIINGSELFSYPLSRNCSYKTNVLLIRQMECAIGQKSYSSIINGDNEFFDKFSQIYGKDIFRYLQYRTMWLKSNENYKFFDETQNVLLKTIFDKDFDKIDSIEDAKQYFTKLLEFSNYRGVFNDSKFLYEYYDLKKEDVKKCLQEKVNCSESDIKDFEKFLLSNIDPLIENKKNREKK